VTLSKTCIHLRLSDLCPPASNSLYHTVPPQRRRNRANTQLVFCKLIHGIHVPMLLLARALPALIDPYCHCQSTCLCVSVCVCLCVLVLNISTTKRLMGSCPLGPYRKVPMARRLVTSSISSRDYDVILATSQYSKSSNLETKINYPCGPKDIVLKHEHTLDNNCRRSSISRDRTLTEIRHFFMTKAHRSESKAPIDYPRGTL